METGVELYEKEGGIYAATPEDICLVCQKKIGKEMFSTSLKLDPLWDRKEKFDFDKHVLDELVGYKHFRCLK